MTGAWHIGLFAAPVPPPYIAPAVQMPCRGARRGLARRPRRARACSRMWPGGWCCDNASSQSRCCAGVARRVMGHRRRTASGPLCGAAPGTAHVGAAHLPLDVPVALLAEYRLRGGGAREAAACPDAPAAGHPPRPGRRHDPARRQSSGRIPAIGSSGRSTRRCTRPPRASRRRAIAAGPRYPEANHARCRRRAVYSAATAAPEPRRRTRRATDARAAPTTYPAPVRRGGRPGHDIPRDRRARSRRITPCGREPPRPGT